MNVNQMAHVQWATRPEDERKSTLAECYKLAFQRYEAKQIVSRPTLHIQSDGADLLLNGLGRLNYHSLGQLSHYTGYPARVASKLGHVERADLVADSFNALLADQPMSFKVWQDTQTNVVRGITTDVFGHIYDRDLITFLLDLTENETNNWKRPKAYTDEDYPSGYYMSDHDCFFIVANDNAQIDDGGMGLGLIVSNSEVGNSKALFGMVFGYRYICGNHMIWGFQQKAKWKVIHRGDRVNHKFVAAKSDWETMTLSARKEYERILKLARAKFLPSTDEVVEVLTAKKIGYTNKAAQEIITHSIYSGWDPTNVFSLWDSATTLSHGPHQDNRLEADTQAGRILQLAN